MKNVFGLVLMLIITSCSKSSDSGNSSTPSKLNIPNMTGAVSSTAAIANSSPVSQQGSGVLFTGTAPSDTIVGNVFGMVKNFVSNAKSSDTYACMIEVLANNGLLKTDGTETVFADDQNNQFKAKFIVNASGTALQNFKMYICLGTATSNSQYVTGTMSGSEMSFSMKFNLASILEGSMSLTGTLSGDNWVSKSLTMETATTASGTTYSSKFLITQNASNMLLKGIYTPGTVTNSYQTYAKFALIGSTPATYAMGAGSSKYAISGGSDSTKHWDIDGGTSGVTSSTFATDVATGTYFPTSFTFTGTMGSGETWDCATGSATLAKLSTMGTAVITSLQSCSDNQQ